MGGGWKSRIDEKFTYEYLNKYNSLSVCTKQREFVNFLLSYQAFMAIEGLRY